MDVVISIIIFIIGGVVGFFANKTLSASSQEQKLLTKKVSQSEDDLAQYKLNVAKHLDSSAKLLDQMNSTCLTAMKQMAESTTLLQKATVNDQEHMPFFSKETQEQLTETVTLRHQKKVKPTSEIITESPLDYSGNPSGLFDDKKQTVTNAE